MAEDSPIGATLAGKYEVRRLLGRGGMGAVYEGLHVEIGKRVAIKLLDREHSRHEEIAGRFRREGRAASRVESEHVVQVFDVGEDATWGLYMVMEFLVGEDLATRLQREKLLDVPVALEIAWQAARGLAKAHAAGVIHRDLKPGNIFLAEREDGSTIVKLVDFGISKLTDEGPGKAAITRHGSAVGTPQYMSPEQAQGHAIDQRTDVWALGAVLYEMVSGKQAYDLLDNYEQTIFAIVLKKPPLLPEIAPWVPDKVVSIVEKALEHDLDKRIPDGATFARMLTEALSSSELSMPASTNAPLALTRRSTGSHPRIEIPPRRDAVVVIPAGAPQIVERRPIHQAETAPAISAVDPASDPRVRAQSASTERPPPSQPAVTVTGVAVKTGRHSSIDPPPDDLYLPQRRSRAGVVVALLLVAVSGVASWFYFLGVPPQVLQLYRQIRPGGAAATPAAEAAPVASSSSSSPTSTAASIATATPATHPSPSHKPAAVTKPSAKPPVAAKPIASTVAATPSASASAKPATTTSEDQFGGIGVSSSY